MDVPTLVVVLEWLPKLNTTVWVKLLLLRSISTVTALLPVTLTELVTLPMLLALAMVLNVPLPLAVTLP